LNRQTKTLREENKRRTRVMTKEDMDLKFNAHNNESLDGISNYNFSIKFQISYSSSSSNVLKKVRVHHK
jgi:hypothetical protein